MAFQNIVSLFAKFRGYNQSNLDHTSDGKPRTDSLFHEIRLPASGKRLPHHECHLGGENKAPDAECPSAEDENWKWKTKRGTHLSKVLKGGRGVESTRNEKSEVHFQFI